MRTFKQIVTNEQLRGIIEGLRELGATEEHICDRVEEFTKNEDGLWEREVTVPDYVDIEFVERLIVSGEIKMKTRPKPPNCCGDPNNALSPESEAMVLRGLEDARKGRVRPYVKPDGYLKRLIKAIFNVY